MTEDDIFPEFENRDLCIDDIDKELASKEKDWESDWDAEDNDEFSMVLRKKLEEDGLLPLKM